MISLKKSFDFFHGWIPGAVTGPVAGWLDSKGFRQYIQFTGCNRIIESAGHDGLYI